MGSVFLDVGGHLGQTIDEVIKPRYFFDKIYCFEPSPEHARRIREKYTDPRLEVMAYGLSNMTGELKLYSNGLNDMGATVKEGGYDLRSDYTICKFVKASEFFQKYIKKGDLVLMKLNCEGSECDIMNDLIDSGEVNKISNVMIDFDVRKFRNMENEEHKLMKRLDEINFDRVSLCKKVMKGKTHQDRIANWLRSVRWHEQFREPVSKMERFKGAILR